VVLNGHGGNAAPNKVVRDILSEQNMFIITYNWWDSVEDMISKSGDSDSDVGHAGEWETSTQLFIREQLVSKPHIGADVPLTSPFDPETAGFATFAERRRDTRDRTGIMGDARVATKEKGKAILTLAIDRLVTLICEFRSLPIREYREFGTYCP
jgi:creatinine amidohydrolase